MSTGDGYLGSLQVVQSDHHKLASAREIIRDTLRDAFRNWESFVSRVELLDQALAKAGVSPDVPVRLPIPKFRIQGSFDYHTANDCQHPPAQQLDMDDGMFLPQAFIFVGGKARPALASHAYFALVERALRPVCERHGWILNPTVPAKGSCVRVEISSRLHIDLPLYAIRDSAFDQLVEFAAASSLRKASEIRDSVELDEGVYRDLADSEIILAHREKGWIQSDPRKLSRWFSAAVDTYGPMVRDLSRALKGLRDARWLQSDLGSICIMAAVVSALEQIDEIDPARFDIALVKVGNEVARLMAYPIENPVFPGQADKNLCAGWSPNFRAQIQTLFDTASRKLESAMNDSYVKSLAIARAREAYGQRVPDDESLITIASMAAVVRREDPQRQPKPMVPRTRSG
ncbi:MAG: cyclic synthase [Sphingomonadales bacterium]|jgi:hypothetical protein|nr:cyclic synthase [Sphingomonadales bacterium]